MELICCKCQRNSIPAPAGATSKTRFICRECSPLGPDELRFDSCQFDAGMLPLSGYGAEARFKVDGMRIEAQVTDIAEAIEAIRRRILAGEEVAFPAAIEKAAKNGNSSWVKAVNARNLLLLPDRMCQVFLLFYWGKLSHPQIASYMRISERSSEVFLARAKDRLGRSTNVVQI